MVERHVREEEYRKCCWGTARHRSFGRVRAPAVDRSVEAGTTTERSGQAGWCGGGGIMTVRY